MSEVYDYPTYYDIAFSFRDIPAEVDLFEECFRCFSKISVKEVLELACGQCPHATELAKRGYRYHGLDQNETMLEYSRGRANAESQEWQLVRGDMVEFDIDEAVDFVYIMLGSLAVQNSAELVSHFDSVARALKPGGLYLLDWCIHFELPLEHQGGVSWDLERDGIQVNTNVSWTAVNRVEQLFNETITFKVNDHGKELVISGTDPKRAIFPQEFLLFISAREDFEFVGWWNNWDLERPLKQDVKIDRPVVVVRRV
jgi:SAM-dependent methyltransferase